MHTNAFASHVKQHLLKPLMVHQVVCLGPVHHHDDTISVGINQAVDHHDVVPDVSAWDDSGVDGEEGFNSVKSQCISFSSSTEFV